MNSAIQEKWAMVDGSHKMRDEVLAQLSDADLAFNPGGQNMSLGELWREFGEIEQAYIDSWKTFRQDFTYRYPDASIATSVARLKTWFAQLDGDMQKALDSISDADVKKEIDRGSFKCPADMQIDVYLQALLIFFGKLTVFVRAMNRPLTKMMQDWIG